MCGYMFTSNESLRALFSFASMALLLASTAAGQDKTSATPSSSDAATFSIPKQNPLAGVTPGKTSVAQDSLEFFSDFEDFPYQAGSSLNAGGIGYGLLRQEEAMKRLKTFESLTAAGGSGR